MRFRLLLASLVCTATPLFAQQSSAAPVELGFDASIMRLSASGNGIDGSVTIAQFPMQSVRLTVPMTPYVSLEPAMSLLYFNGGGEDQTSFSGEVAALIHFSPDRTKPQFFVRPFVGWSKDAIFETLSGDHATAGAGLGVKIPARDRIAFRLEGRYRHAFENDGVSLNAFGFVAGLSFALK